MYKTGEYSSATEEETKGDNDVGEKPENKDDDMSLSPIAGLDHLNRLLKAFPFLGAPVVRGRSPKVGGDKKLGGKFTKFCENFRESLNLVINSVRKCSQILLKLFFCEVIFTIFSDYFFNFGEL